MEKLNCGLLVSVDSLTREVICPVSGYPNPSTAYERIANGAFTPPGTSWSVEGFSWSIEELGNATHNGTATDQLSQTLSNPLESGKYYILTFDVTAASTAAYRLSFYQTTTLVQDVANQVLGVGSHSFRGIVAGNANRFVVTPVATGGGTQIFDNFSLMV